MSNNIHIPWSENLADPAQPDPWSVWTLADFALVLVGQRSNGPVLDLLKLIDEA